MQSHAGPVIADSVSVSPYETFLVDSVGHFLLVSFIYSDSYSLSSPSSTGFPVQFRIFLLIMSGCEFLHSSHLLPEEAFLMMTEKGTNLV